MKLIYLLILLIVGCTSPIHQIQDSSPKVMWAMGFKSIILIGHAGSSVAIHEDGEYTYLITAKHLLAFSTDPKSPTIDTVEVFLPQRDGEFSSSYTKVIGEVVAVSDNERDIGLVRFKGKSKSISRLSSSLPKVGDHAYVAGYPMNTWDIMVTNGHVTRVQKLNGIISINSDAPVMVGDSGGGLFNSSGECIGIVQNIMWDSHVFNRSISSLEVIEWIKSTGKILP